MPVWFSCVKLVKPHRQECLCYPSTEYVFMKRCTEVVIRRIHWALALLAATLPAQSLLPADLANALTSVGEAGVEFIASPGPGFTGAFRIATLQPGRTMSDAALYWTNAA